VTLVSLLFGAIVSMVGAVPQGVDLASLKGWDIVVGEDALPSEYYAAEEFQSHFARAGGGNLAIVKTVDRPDRHVFIGPSKAMRESPVGFSTDEFGPEDLRIVVRDRNIAVAGGRPRGTLYGVYTFLEDYLGVRFLTADHTHVPRIGRWRVIGPVDKFYHPPLEFRWSFYGETNHPEFAARLRNNVNVLPGWTRPYDLANFPKLGGRTAQDLISHSFYKLIPMEKYAKDHPEYYAMIDGELIARIKSSRGPYEIKSPDRFVYGIQPCLTNPDVLRIVTEAVLDEFKSHPQIANISVGQNDGKKYCRCPRCAAIDRREDTPMGSLLTFVNAVADEVARKYPGKMVGTLAYAHTQKPPKKLKARPNVQIQIASINSCMIHRIDDPTCRRNVVFFKRLRRWKQHCENIYVRGYNHNLSHNQLPWPNLRTIGPYIRVLAANNVKGIFMQATGSSTGNEFSDLRNYVTSRLLWDPSRSGRELMDEFLNLHYGRAAPPIRQFINLIHNQAEASGLHCRSCEGRAKEYGLDESTAEAGLKLFAEAIKLAENETVRKRVEKASVCAYRLAIEPIWDVQDKDKLDPALAERMRPLVRRFFELCRKHGLTRINTSSRKPRTVDDFYQRFKRLLDL